MTSISLLGFSLLRNLDSGSHSYQLTTARSFDILKPFAARYVPLDAPEPLLTSTVITVAKIAVFKSCLAIFVAFFVELSTLADAVVSAVFLCGAAVSVQTPG